MMGLGFLIKPFVFAVLVLFIWRVTEVWPTARAWRVRSIGAWREAFARLFRFIYLATKKKTVTVSSEMAQLQTTMSAVPTRLYNPTSLLTPVWLGIAGLVVFLGVLSWALFLNFFVIPGKDKKIAQARNDAAVAVGANEGWENVEANYKAKLDAQNKQLEEARQASVAGELDAYRRGRAEALVKNRGRAKQEEIARNAETRPDSALDPDSFLRELGLSPPGGDAPGVGGEPADRPADAPPPG